MDAALVDSCSLGPGADALAAIATASASAALRPAGGTAAGAGSRCCWGCGSRLGPDPWAASGACCLPHASHSVPPLATEAREQELPCVATAVRLPPPRALLPPPRPPQQLQQAGGWGSSCHPKAVWLPGLITMTGSFGRCGGSPASSASARQGRWGVRVQRWRPAGGCSRAGRERGVLEPQPAWLNLQCTRAHPPPQALQRPSCLLPTAAQASWQLTQAAARQRPLEAGSAAALLLRRLLRTARAPARAPPQRQHCCCQGDCAAHGDKWQEEGEGRVVWRRRHVGLGARAAP